MIVGVLIIVWVVVLRVLYQKRCWRTDRRLAL